MKDPIESVRSQVKKSAKKVASAIDRLSGSRIHPNHITTAALILHIPVMIAIATRHFTTGAILLIIFGLLDTLDGGLARYQHNVTRWGMVYDSVTDRIKESGIYLSILYIFLEEGQLEAGLLVAAIMATAIIISYTKAMGGVAISDQKPEKINRMFMSGLMSYEIRMFGVVVALLTQQFIPVFGIMLVLTSTTVLQRLYSVYKSLR